MRKLILFFALIIFLIITPNVKGEGAYSDEFRNAVIPEKPLISDEVDLNDPEAVRSEISPERIWEYVLGQFRDGFRDAMKNLITGLSLVMLSVLVTRCIGTLQNQNFQYLFTFIMSISMVLICHDGLSSCAAALKKAIADLQVFTAACIPSFTVVMISAGEGGGASVFSSSMVLLGEIGALLSERIVLPLVDVYLSIGICAVISDEYNFSSIAKQIRRFVIWIIGIAMGFFRLILKMQSGIAAAGDRLTQKTIRSAVGSMIPMVGNTLSQGVDGLFAVASGVKVSFAVAAVLIILSVMLPVLIKILIFGLSWSICRWVADFMNDHQVRAIADVMANGFYMMLAIGSFVALLSIVSFFGIMIQVS